MNDPDLQRPTPGEFVHEAHEGNNPRSPLRRPTPGESLARIATALERIADVLERAARRNTHGEIIGFDVQIDGEVTAYTEGA